METTLFRSLLRVRQELTARPALWRGIRNGVIRHTQCSQAYAQLQEEVTTTKATNAADAFRRSLPAGAVLPALAHLDAGLISEVGIDSAFTTLRCLSDLLAAITKVGPHHPNTSQRAATDRADASASAASQLEDEDAFARMRRSPDVQYVIGQRVEHRELGQCVIYGWDHTCTADEKMGAADLAQAAGLAGLIDNRKAFVGVDSHCDGQQPFYRVQTIYNEKSPSQRSHYSAQEVHRESPILVSHSTLLHTLHPLHPSYPLHPSHV